MATYDEISRIIGIPKRTLVDWKNADDYHRRLFFALKSLSKDELEALLQRADTLHKTRTVAPSPKRPS